MRTRRITAITILILTISALGVASAKESTGSLAGVAKDKQSGATLDGVTVVTTSQQLQGQRTAIAANGGRRCRSQPRPRGARRAAAGSHPVSPVTELSRAPWNDRHQLLRISLRATEAIPKQKVASNLVFPVDSSGSMASEDRLPLVKAGLRRLALELGEQDRVAIVTCAGVEVLGTTAAH